ncbi:UBP1-associated protein 2C-like [Chenopodium quinoa]|uniref:RRM domain-containing protein n=1 Tax=Chenopodium quinoa TaxID=63459 RepID=A0A803L6E2_CHEQI|nr:UBP1-associated protein 2C-like [Chenopodium quinoa]
MDATKKRKADENGNSFVSDATPDLQPPSQTQTLIPEDARKLIEPFTSDQLRSLLQDAVVRHPDVLFAARALADSDVSRRKLFVRGLGPSTTTESLKSLFTSYGELDEAVVISDKTTGKSKGYGFVTFKHVDGALLALRQPNKKIDGRMTVTHLASAGRGPNSEDQATRKIYVGNVPYEISAERLLDYFAAFGEIEEGPLGFDKPGGKARGFAFFVYKTEEGARMALMEPMKMIDGHQVMCKLAEDGKKGKLGGPNPVMPGEMGGGGDRMPGSINPPVGGPMGGYGNYGLGPNSGPGMGVGAAHGPGGGGGYNSSVGGPYGLQSQYPGSGEYPSYRMPPPPSSMGMPPPYQEGSGGYGLPSSGGGGYMSQNHPPSQGPPQGPPPGGMYQRMPPSYY